MPENLTIARGHDNHNLLPRMANRHGLIAGATGTGKTVTLRVIAENFSSLGVPVFMADVKGDLSGVAKPGQENPQIRERVTILGHREFWVRRQPDGVLGFVWGARASRAHDDFRHGTALDGALAQSE